MIVNLKKEWDGASVDVFFMGIMKFSFFLFLMVVFLFHHTAAVFLIWDKEKRLRYFLWSISKTSKSVLKFLGIQVNLVGVRGEVTQKLIVANHLSYLDVVILLAEYPSLFITSQEIKDTPVLGHICQLAGCFFIERRKEFRTARTKENELQMMKEQFHQGHNIFLFPEGTSSNGFEGVLPFKATFFQLAIDTDTAVVPMCLKYQGANAHLMPWYGEMTFVPHLFSVCMQEKIHVSLEVLPEVRGKDKFELAQITHRLIQDSYEKA